MAPRSGVAIHLTAPRLSIASISVPSFSPARRSSNRNVRRAVTSASGRARRPRPLGRWPARAGLAVDGAVPPKPVRTLRNLTRYRKSQIRDRQREMNRLHKVMQDTGIKLDCVATDMIGKSGRAMLDALVAGTTDPVVLADLARGQLPKRRSGKTRKGSKWLSQTLVECATSANRSKNTYLAAQYARLRVRRGANKATIAVCHSILTAVWHMLNAGETYVDPDGDFFARRDPERTRERLIGQLERLGYTVTVQEGAAAA